jgi:hypothetical protein
VVVHGVA